MYSILNYNNTAFYRTHMLMVVKAEMLIFADYSLHPRKNQFLELS